MYTTNDLFFPVHVIPSLQNLRGQKWQDLVCYVSKLPNCHEGQLAFVLMMSRLNGCTTCETDSYRAMRGCFPCAVQTLRRYKGADEDLVAAYEEALADIQLFYRDNHRLSRFIQRADLF